MTAQATKGALAYADGAELQLRIADSVVSTTIDGQVRERVQTRSAQARPSCAVCLVPSGIVRRKAACYERAAVQP